MLDGKYRKELTVDGKKYSYCDFAEFLEDKDQRIEEMPYTIRILLELAFNTEYSHNVFLLTIVFREFTNLLFLL